MQIGIDIGGSLTKIVAVSNGDRQYSLIDYVDPVRVAESLPRGDEIHITGCGSRNLARYLEGPVHISPELECFCAGARMLASEQYPDKDSFVLASVGTGTSIFYVSPDAHVREAGTGVGGGTIAGLGYALLGAGGFQEVMELASQGQRRRVDLMVSDLYPGASKSPVLSALTAANFGRKRSRKAPKADVASAIVQMVVETVAVLSIQVARTYKTHAIVVAGSPGNHPLFRDRFKEIGAHLGAEFDFLDYGAYCGAIGAVLVGQTGLE